MNYPKQHVPGTPIPEIEYPIPKSFEEDRIQKLKYKTPTTSIKNDLITQNEWPQTRTFLDLMGLIVVMGNSVKGIKIGDINPKEISEGVKRINDLLDWVTSIVDSVEPIEKSSLIRYGNAAFKTVAEKVKESFADTFNNLFTDIKPSNGAEIELMDYLIDSLGHNNRLDYGTGHELCFLAFLLCLIRLNYISIHDSKVLTLITFKKYINLTRYIQDRYHLEAAGTHGSWGLDDYTFLPFLFGAGQLVGGDTLPKSTIDENFVRENAKEYLYFDAVTHVYNSKKGPFYEHSPTLNSLSGVPHWLKVYKGLIKMYRGEVMLKFPCVQHFKFGSILPFNE